MDRCAGGREQVEEETILAGPSLAHLKRIVAELGFPPGNHLTLIKGGKETVERKRMAVFPSWEKALWRDLTLGRQKIKDERKMMHF